MTHRYIKIGITSLVLVLAFAALLWSTLREGTEYYMNIKEVLPQRQAWEGKPLRLHGYVVPGSILRKRDSLEYRFKVQNDPPRSTVCCPRRTGSSRTTTPEANRSASRRPSPR